LAEALRRELIAGRQLLARLDDQQYRQVEDGQGSIGQHLRHNLNFVNAVISGIETGVIDYARRVRDRRIEDERAFADAAIVRILDQLSVINDTTIAMEVMVGSEIDPMIVHRSTISRELEFVLSHTIHHYALIKGRIGSEAGIGTEFGVAPSTLEYWNRAAA